MHRDIKLDNILLHSNNWESIESSLVTVIDLSLSAGFLDKDGNHLPLKKEESFNGNMIFSSENIMNLNSKYYLRLKFTAPSRRDDMMSLMYLIIYLKEGSLPWCEGAFTESIDQAFHRVRTQKKVFHYKLIRQQT